MKESPCIGKGNWVTRAITVLFRDYLVLVMITVLVVLTAIVEPKFLSPRNLINIERQFGP